MPANQRQGIVFRIDGGIAHEVDARGIGAAPHPHAGHNPTGALMILALLAASAPETRREGRYVAAFDALRGEHYVATCEIGATGQLAAMGAVERWPSGQLAERAAAIGKLVGRGLELDAAPDAAALIRLDPLLARAHPVDLAAWEPAYGRLAEAQVKWEAVHGRPLPAA